MTDNARAAAVIDGLLGGLQIADKVRHRYTGKMGRFLGYYNAKHERAIVRWFGGSQLKYVKTSVLERV
jgi:hypothetical protein